MKRVVRFAIFLWTVTLSGYSSALFAIDLAPLHRGDIVHVAILGRGWLCDGRVEQRWPDSVTLRLAKSTTECGNKGASLRMSNEEVVAIAPEDRLTKGRIAAKVLLGMAGVAMLAAVPLNSSDPESWLILGNGVIPGFVFYGGWKAVPKRRDYLVAILCQDRLHCFSERNR